MATEKRKFVVDECLLLCGDEGEIVMIKFWSIQRPV